MTVSNITGMQRLRRKGAESTGEVQPEPVMPEKAVEVDYSSMKVAELRKIAEELNLDRFQDMRKGELVLEIEKVKKA